MEIVDDTFSDLASFSLSKSFDETVGGDPKGDYTFLLYLGSLLLVLVVGGFIYKFYINQKRVRFSENTNKGDDEIYHKIS